MAAFLLALCSVQALEKGDACNVNNVDCPGDFPCLYNVETYAIKVKTPNQKDWTITETINGKEYVKEGEWPHDDIKKLIANGGVAMTNWPCKDFFDPPEKLRCICKEKLDLTGGNSTHPGPNGGSPDGSNAADSVASGLWSVTKAVLSFLLLVGVIGLVLLCLYTKRESIYTAFNKLESRAGHVDATGNHTSGKTMATSSSQKDLEKSKRHGRTAHKSRRSGRKS